ncbi:unnamed protein product [Mortierella alpina]
MKSEQPELWSPPPSSSASTSTASLSGEDVDAEDRPVYDTDELQHPSSDSALNTDASDSNAETSSQDPPTRQHPAPATLASQESTNSLPLHHRTDSDSSSDPDMDFCIVERVDKQESLDDHVVPPSATQRMELESVPATATVPAIKATQPHQVAAGEQEASPSQLLPSLLDYDAILTTVTATATNTTATTTTTSAVKGVTRLALDPARPIQTAKRCYPSPTEPILTARSDRFSPYPYPFLHTSMPTETESSLSRNKSHFSSTSKPTKTQSSVSRNKRRSFAQESQLFMLAVLGAIGVSILLLLGIVWALRSARSTSVQPPSHAFVRHVDYSSDGLMGIIHIDLYTSKGTPFLSHRVHPFHIRVNLGDQSKKNWTPQTTPRRAQTNMPDLNAPLVQDLGNGTYRLHLHRPDRAHYRQQKPLSQNQHPYQAQDQDQDQVHATELKFKSWLCPEMSPYYLHLWFENGTRVPDTPHRLEWSSTAVPLHPKASSRTASATTSSSGAVFEHRHHQDSQEQGAMRVWTHGLQPVLCELYRISDAVMSFTFLMSKIVLSLVAHSIDRLVGIEDFAYTHAVKGWMRAQLHLKVLISKASSFCGQATKHPVSHHGASFSPSSAPAHTPVPVPVPAPGSVSEQKAPTDLVILLHEHVQSLTRAVGRVNLLAAGYQHLPTAEKVLDTADRILVVVEEHVVKLIQSERVQRISQHLQAEKVLHAADRVFLKTELGLERWLKTDAVQKVNRRLKRQMEELQATPQGQRWSHRWQGLRERLDCRRT